MRVCECYESEYDESYHAQAEWSCKHCDHDRSRGADRVAALEHPLVSIHQRDAVDPGDDQVNQSSKQPEFRVYRWKQKIAQQEPLARLLVGVLAFELVFAPAGQMFAARVHRANIDDFPGRSPVRL